MFTTREQLDIAQTVFRILKYDFDINIMTDKYPELSNMSTLDIIRYAVTDIKTLYLLMAAMKQTNLLMEFESLCPIIYNSLQCWYDELGAFKIFDLLNNDNVNLINKTLELNDYKYMYNLIDNINYKYFIILYNKINSDIKYKDKLESILIQYKLENIDI